MNRLLIAIYCISLILLACKEDIPKKEKTEKGIKKAYKKLYPPKKSEPEQKVDMSSAGSYYASKKPGQYTGD